jgi:hypothetical protein
MDLLADVQHQGAQDAITSLRRRPCVFGVIVCRNRHGANRHDAACDEQPGAPLAAPGAVVPIAIATAIATATAPALVRFPGPYREVGCVDSTRKRALRLGAEAEAGPTGPTSGGAAAQQRGQDAEGRHYARMDVSMLRGVWYKEGTERHWALGNGGDGETSGPGSGALDTGHWTLDVVRRCAPTFSRRPASAIESPSRHYSRHPCLLTQLGLSPVNQLLHLHIHRLVEAEHSISHKEAVHPIRYRPPPWLRNPHRTRLVRPRVCNVRHEHQSGRFDRFDEGGRKILTLLDTTSMRSLHHTCE